MFETGRLPAPHLSDHPVDVGLRSEAAIIARLAGMGYRLLVPLGFNERYDVAVDAGDGQIVRGQCKTGRLKNGGVFFSTRSARCNSNNSYVRDYHGEADVFFVYCRALDALYCVPVSEAPKREMCLRIEPSRNGQSSGVRFASDYEMPA